jgi:hypothetical protein
MNIKHLIKALRWVHAKREGKCEFIEDPKNGWRYSHLTFNPSISQDDLDSIVTIIDTHVLLPDEKIGNWMGELHFKPGDK